MLANGLNFNVTKINLFVILLLLVPLSLFFPGSFVNLSFALLFIYCVVNRKKNIFRSIASTKVLLVPMLLFVVYLIAAIATQKPDGIDLVGRKIAILLIPVSFILVNKTLTEKQFHLIMVVIVACCIVVSLFCFTRALINIIQNHSLIYPNELYKLYYFSYYPLTDPFEPIYISLYSNLAFIATITSCLIKYKWKIIICLYLALFIILIAAKVGIISLFLIIFLYIITSRLDKILIYSGACLLIVLCSFAIYKLPFLKERFLTSFNFDISERNGAKWNSNTIRIAIWSCAIDAIHERPIFGYGPVEGQIALEHSYKKNDFAFGLYYKTYEGIPQYNAHNEFLSTTLDLGIVGLMVMVGVFFIPFINAVKTKSFIKLSVLTLLFSYCMVESILLRQKGIVTFSFFYSIIFWHDFSGNHKS